VTASGQQTYYEILSVSPDGSREDIELACLGLWYKYKIMRTTPLWAELNRQIEEIHATLSNPEIRAAYDRYLRDPNPAKRFPSLAIEPPQDSVQITTPAAARPPLVKFRKVFSFNATGGALLFNGLISHVRPQEWSDMSTLGGIALFFSLGTTLLVWSVAKLFPAKVAAEELATSAT
jgi:curved DNA-binding protein CbpA